MTNNNVKMTVLEQCPLCGGNAEFDYHEAYSTDSSFECIKCQSCGVMLPGRDAQNWNTRITGQYLTDEDIRTEWRAAGGHMYGPNIETVAMPEVDYFRFRRSINTPTVTGDMVERYCIHQYGDNWESYASHERNVLRVLAFKALTATLSLSQ